MTAARLLGAAAAVALAFAPAPARGHGRSTSYGVFDVRGGVVRAAVRLDARDATALLAGHRGAHPPDLAALVAGSFSVSFRGRDCRRVPGSLIRLLAAPGTRAVAWRLRCPAPPDAIASRLLAAEIPHHVHIATVRRPSRPARTLIFAPGGRTHRLGAGEGGGAPPDLLGFLRLGMAHILSGADHLVFLGLLLLGARRGRDLFAAITGFTAGHSLTLATVALGVLRPSAPVVEALIGFSIALLALEVVARARGRAERGLVGFACALPLALAAAALAAGAGPPRTAMATALAGAALFAGCYLPLAPALPPGRAGFGVAALFGLVHGLGFGGALAEVGLPAGRAVSALFAFNAGVEIIQLALAALAWPLLAAARARGSARLRRRLVEWLPAAAMAAGVFWLIDRAL